MSLFAGKLFDQIRSRDGLAYSVGGGWVSAPLDHPGLFIASAVSCITRGAAMPGMMQC